MKNTLLVIVFSVLGFFSYSQTDSTDLNYYMTDPILLDEMDSMMFTSTDYGQFYIEFDVSDTSYFNGVNIEITTTEDGETLYKGDFSKSNLLNTNSLNSNWHTTIDLGKLEKNITYTITFVVKDFNGLLGESIIKHFIYETN